MERIEKEEQAKKLIKYLYSQNNNQKGARQQQYPITFVTYAISRTRTTTT
jgi:acyl CoA:acetate/3-ketoacid CoA transferase